MSRYERYQTPSGHRPPWRNLQSKYCILVLESFYTLFENIRKWTIEGFARKFIWMVLLPQARSGEVPGPSCKAQRRWASTNTELGLCSLELGAAMHWCLIHTWESRGACGKTQSGSCIWEVTMLPLIMFWGLEWMTVSCRSWPKREREPGCSHLESVLILKGVQERARGLHQWETWGMKWV